jgi:peptidyl-tRNA hydrolase, PTH1 family
MKLIVGLGNPGKQYQNTRHNIGQKIVLDYLKTQKNCRLKENYRLSAKTCETGWKTSKKIFAISSEFMNNSGITVQKISHFFKIEPKDIYVVHDDLDLEVGDYRIQFDRGSAGHNGIKSINQYLGTQQFNRIRIGIGKPQNSIPIEDYVLQPFPKDESAIIDSIAPKIFEEIEKIMGR